MGGAFSILWPTKNSNYGDQVNRDFFADEKNESKKISISKSIMTNPTAGDMYFNFATETRRKSFLDFWHNRLKRLDSDVSKWHLAIFQKRFASLV